MELYEYRQTEGSIVLVGTFFPLLLIPQWFIRNKLLPEEDSGAQIEVIVKELTKFTVASISIEVQEAKLVLKSAQQAFDYLIRDLALGIITLLPEANVTHVGLNVNVHIECKDHNFWHFIGDSLAPKQLWNDIVPDSPRVGLKNIQLQAKKSAGEIGNLNFGFSWLNRPDWAQLSLNNHFSNGIDVIDAADKKLSEDKFDPLSIVEREWDSTLALHKRSRDHIFESLAKEYANVRRS